MMDKGDESPILYYKEQGNDNLSCFPKLIFNNGRKHNIIKLLKVIKGASVYYLTILNTENLESIIVEMANNGFGGVILKIVHPRLQHAVKLRI